MSREKLHNELSTHERIMNSGDNELISRYLLKYMLFLAVSIFLGYLGYTIFDPTENIFGIDWSTSGDSWAALDGRAKALTVLGAMTATVAIGSYTIPRMVEWSRNYDDRIIEAIDTRKGQEKDRADKNLTNIEHIRTKQFDILSREISSLIKDNRSTNDTETMIERKVKEYHQAVCNQVDMEILYNQLYHKLSVEFLASVQMKPDLLSWIDDKRGKENRQNCIESVANCQGNASPIQRVLICNALKDCGFDVEKAVKDGATYPQFHERYYSALHSFASKHDITFNIETHPECIPDGYIQGLGMQSFVVEDTKNKTSKLHYFKGRSEEDRKKEYEETVKTFNGNQRISKVTFDSREYHKILKDSMSEHLGDAVLSNKPTPLKMVYSKLESRGEERSQQVGNY